MGQKLCYMLGKNPVNKSRYGVSLQGAPSSIEICIFKKQTQKYMMNDTTYSKAKVSGGHLRVGKAVPRIINLNLEDRRFTR